MDFLLSLSAKAKEKLAKSMPENPNKSVMYADQSLSEEDVSSLSLYHPDFTHETCISNTLCDLSVLIIHFYELVLIKK